MSVPLLSLVKAGLDLIQYMMKWHVKGAVHHKETCLFGIQKKLEISTAVFKQGLKNLQTIIEFFPSDNYCLKSNVSFIFLYMLFVWLQGWQCQSADWFTTLFHTKISQQLLDGLGLIQNKSRGSAHAHDKTPAKTNDFPITFSCV